uniref:Uncharacterized protein n=1 Tax=Rangifer tarandus platyrhynchus TaxID=3082113 RepID=A0ACB0E6J3_RANTA|nr:unnamed protein product [Rangifer tarandus platyrhynchus]
MTSWGWGLGDALSQTAFGSASAVHPEVAGRSWPSATRKETHARDRLIRFLHLGLRKETHARARLIRFLHLGLPGSRTLRNKCVRLKPHSAAFLLAEAWTGTAAASVVMICGDDREGGPQTLHPGARGASLPV